MPRAPQEDGADDPEMREYMRELDAELEGKEAKARDSDAQDGARRSAETVAAL